MKTIRDFLRKHALLLLAALVVVSVPVGTALGKYAASETVTSSLNLTVTAATVSSAYTIDKARMQTVLKGLKSNNPTSLSFVKGSEVAGMTRKDEDGIHSGDGVIGVYMDGTDIYIAPVGDDTAVMCAPEDCSEFLSNSKTTLGDLLTSIDCSNLNTSKVTIMKSMFNNCRKLASLKLPSSFKTSAVTDMSSMFYNCKALTSLDLSGFDTSNVTNMSHMFDLCSSLDSLDISTFKTDNVKSMSGMFRYCEKLSKLDISNFDTGNVTTMDAMFDGCSGLNSLNVSKLNTENVTTMSAMFRYCRDLSVLDVSNFKTKSVITMDKMFLACNGLTELDVSNFNTENVITMAGMFYGCSGLSSLNLTSFDTSNVTNMSEMFRSCDILTTLDLSSFDTSMVTDMTYMFCSCTKLKTIYASNKFVVDKAKCDNMFGNPSSDITRCTSLVGGKNTTYNRSYTHGQYARIDGGPNSTTPGYFTDKNATQSLTYSATGTDEAANGFGLTRDLAS